MDLCDIIKIDELVKYDLKQSIESLEQDLETVKGGKCVGMVSWDDPQADMREIKKYLKSFYVVAEYYGVDFK